MKIDWHKISWENPGLSKLDVVLVECPTCEKVHVDVAYPDDTGRPVPCGHVMCGKIITKRKKRKEKK